MAIGSPQWMYSSGSAYEIANSLRFNDDDSAYLSWTPASDGNMRTFTTSVWVKRADWETYTQILNAYVGDGSTTRDSISISNSGQVEVIGYNGGVVSRHKSTALLRDCSAWYHILVAVDTTNGTADNRVIIYINGERAALSTNTNPSENYQFVGFNNTAAEHAIGKSHGTNYANDYLAEYHFIDGTAELPSAFGETGDYGEWKPIEYSGTYGTNGFYLPMNQDYTVEGFSAVTYTGNGVNGQYIGGTGFKPALTWIKERSSGSSHQLHDQVRGAGNALYSNDTGTEDYSSTTLQAFNNDGFTVGSHGAVNASGDTYVAWNWDMGASDPAHFVTAGGNAQHSTTQNKIGSSSLKFDGTGDYLSISDPNITFGGDDFTIEYWINMSNTPDGTEYEHIGQTDGTGLDQWRIDHTSSRIEVQLDSNSVGHINLNNSGSSQITAANTWYHIAVVRNGDTVTLYLNGTSSASATWSGADMLPIDADLFIGNWRDNTGGVNGYMDEVRISNTARYTANFTPSTVAFTDDSNTLVLIHSNTTNGSTTFTDSHGTALNTDGTITSRVKANTTYGQSIVSYTGTGSNATIGHGLSSAPELIILKNRDRALQNWSVFHKDLNDGTNTGQYNLFLNLGAGEASGEGFWNNTVPASTVFSVGTTNGSNGNTDKFIAYCFHSVSGYSSIGSYTGNLSTTGPSVTTGFKPAFVMAKKETSASWFMYDSARSPTNTIETALMADNAGSESYVGTTGKIDFNANGFQIKASNNDVNASGVKYRYMAFADKREAAFWLDASGNNNDWTPNNLTESDVSKDSPTNNFATLNPLDHNTTNLLEGNLETWATGWGEAPSTFWMTTGKWYWEMYLKGETPWNDSFVGMVKGATKNTHSDYDAGRMAVSTAGTWFTEALGAAADFSGTASSFTDGALISCTFDADAGIFKIYKDNVLMGTSSSTSEYATATEGWKAYVGGYTNTAWVANFGQDSSFAGNKTAQGNQDSNEIGDFYYTPPNSFLALCTSNLPAVAVVPSEHFNTVTWTGNGGTTNVTGVGFQPDLVWNKTRNYARHHWWWDSIRGVSRWLQSSNTDGDGYLSGKGVTSFDSDGATWVYDSNNGFNTNNQTQVSWNWKANGTGVSNTNGTITSTVSANADAGFSIVSFTAPSSSTGITIGHGLSAKPDMIILKSRGTSTPWYTWHKDLSSETQSYLDLSGTGAVASNTSVWNNTAPTSSVFSTLSGYSIGNNLGGIAYCFHSVDGYSKVGSYSGTANPDGPFIYTGFRPAYVLIKASNLTGQGSPIFDNARDTYNPTVKRLQSNSTATELTTDANIDMLSNGFKAVNTDGSHNSSVGTYIYIAFAEQPFKHSNAR